MAISITPSPFGSVTVTLDGELGGVLSVSVLATSNSVLDMAIGTPGPAGATGSQGPTGATGATGAAGVGVPVGGTTSQALVKVSGTNYDTTWAGPFLDLAGGTLSGTLFLPGLRNLLNTDLTVTAYNDTGAGTNFIHTFDAFDGTFALATNGGGLKFPDETVQTTAGLPLTGGTLTGAVTFDGAAGAGIVVENYAGTTTSIGDGLQLTDGVNNLQIYTTGIIFPDSTTQVTAGLPLTGGTVTGAVLFDSVLVTFGGDGAKFQNGDGEIDISGSGIVFSDSTTQTTAFPPSGGLVTEYITGTGTLVTFPTIPSFATTAQAQAGTSTTTVISPATLLDAKYFQGGKSMVQIAWSTSVSGTGASAGAQNSNARLNVAPTTATGYAIASAVIANNSRGSIFNSGFDFSKRVQFGVRVARNVASPDSASVFRFSIGKVSATGVGDLSARGIMIKVEGSGVLQLLVHNGTTLTSTNSSFTPTNGQAYDVIVTSDGAGACVLYVNGSSVATSSGGPTTAGLTNANYLMFEVQNTSVITVSPQNMCVSDYHVQVNS